MKKVKREMESFGGRDTRLLSPVALVQDDLINRLNAKDGAILGKIIRVNR